MAQHPKAPITSDRLVAQVKQQIEELDVHQLKRQMDGGNGLAVIDRTHRL